MSSSSVDPAAALASAASDAAPSDFPRLTRLAVTALCRDWLTTRASLHGLPTALSKPVWKEVRALLKRHERPVSCADMFPFVQSCWRVEALDLSDAGKWLTNESLNALAHLASLRSVRLTACRFISDEGLGFVGKLPLTMLDLSWTEVGDAGLASSVAPCATLTSLNLTGLQLSDRGVSSLLRLCRLERLSLCATPITDAALDYLTYYSRYPDAVGADGMGMHGLRWLELSSTRLTDTGVGKLVAVIEEGKPYGKVFKQLEYLALSSTNSVTPSAVRQVRVKYGFDTPLPNAQRTLAKSNAVALDAQAWVLRLNPTDRQLPAPSRAWEEDRVVAYVAAWTKEMAASQEVIRMLTAADHAPPPAKRLRVGP